MRVTIKQIEKALKASGGFISQAAVKLGITQGAVSHRIKRSEKLQETLMDIKESYLDLTESKLIKKINDEDLGAICFYLKCQGKARGYIEKAAFEITGKDEGPIKVDVDPEKILKERGIPIPEIGIDDLGE